MKKLIILSLSLISINQLLALPVPPSDYDPYVDMPEPRQVSQSSVLSELQQKLVVDGLTKGQAHEAAWLAINESPDVAIARLDLFDVDPSVAERAKADL